MSGPLEGLKVLDLTRLQPGNYATLLMADLGADVIKVEEPGRGDYVRWTPPMIGEMSAAHRVLNRNKRSVTLNLKATQGPQLLQQLVVSADVLIESFRPGVMDRLGVGYGRLSEINPRLVYAAITGYGQDGPYRDRVGHDINYVAMSGLLATTGSQEGPPVLPSVQVADLAGAMMAVVGVLAALHSRGTTGKGEFVDVGMMDAAYSWLALHLAPWFGGADPLRRGAGLLNGGYPFYRVYRCSDGAYLSVGAIEPRFWSALCTALGHPELIDDQFAPQPRLSEVHRLLEETFATKTRDEWTELLAELETCVAPVNEIEEAAADPQLMARDMVSEQPLNDAPGFRRLGIPLKLTEEPGSIRLEAPGLGEHNKQVYAELGLSPDDLDELSADGTI